MTVEHLVKRIRQQDQRAMSQLYQQYAGRLSSVCYRYVPARDDAKDVLQDSFVKIFRAIPTFEYRNRESFEGWMVKVVAHEAIKYMRNRHPMVFTNLDETTTQETDDTDEEPDTRNISADELHQLIRTMPDGYRTVVNLYVFEGYSHKKIAQLMGIKETTSATQLFKAKKWLARQIKTTKEQEK